MAKAPYKTKQMTEILTFLKSVQGRHVTVNEICDFFREKGISVGTTTIYRHLEKMVKEGLAAKYVTVRALPVLNISEIMGKNMKTAIIVNVRNVGS